MEFAEITLWLDTMAEGLQARGSGCGCDAAIRSWGLALLLHARSGQRQALAHHPAYCGAAHRHRRPHRAGPPRAQRLRRPHPPLAAACRRLGSDVRIQGSQGARPRPRGQGQGLAEGDQGQADEEATRPAGGDLPPGRGVVGDGLPPPQGRRGAVSPQDSVVGMPADLADGQTPSSVTREQIEESLADDDGAYRRLRRMMDAWTALWFWPLTGDEVAPPTLDQWIDAAQGILGTQKLSSRGAKQGMGTLSPADQWEAMADQENFELAGAGARRVKDVLVEHPWLRVCEEVAREQGFFHWHLDFAPVFGRGGFALQLGNPPWVRPRTDTEALLAETDPWWQLANKPSEVLKNSRRPMTLLLPGPCEASSKATGRSSRWPSSFRLRRTFPSLVGSRTYTAAS
ncbi:hypothetical protein [Tessaracoccus coleopterorum]|uniref:hypothetical protein n=1 Tax=Tessaracoccus coleopterorum TaxID=2714950 RepID=UPI0038CD3A5D